MKEDYHELDSLDQITDFDSDKDSFVVLNNGLPHSAALLSYPNYDLSLETDKSYKPKMKENVSQWTMAQYHLCMASLKLVGKYLEFLKKNNLYDNTRIILVADHGSPVEHDGFKFAVFNLHNPLLLVKDFNQTGSLVTDSSVVSNADVPLLATKDVIKKPKNVYTNKTLQKAKTEENRVKKGMIVKKGNDWNPALFIGKEKVFSNGKYAYFKGGDPSQKENWQEPLELEEAKKLMKNAK